MSARRSIYVKRSVDCDPGEPPNRYVGRITVDLRLYFPPHIHSADLRNVAVEAVRELWARIAEWEAELALTKTTSVWYHDSSAPGTSRS